MESFATEKFPIRKDLYKKLDLYARKDDRSNLQSVIGKAIEYFLTEYELQPPCSHCGKMMEEAFDGKGDDCLVIDCKVNKRQLAQLGTLAGHAKVKVHIVLVKAVKNYLERREEAANKLICAHCGSEKYEVRNHDPKWGDGEIHCKKCGTYFRDFDSG